MFGGGEKDFQKAKKMTSQMTRVTIPTCIPNPQNFPAGASHTNPRSVFNSCEFKLLSLINYNAILIFTESHISENDFKSDVMTSTALLFFWQKLTFPNSSIFPNNNRCNVSENQKSNLHAPPTLRLKKQSAATRAVHPPGDDKGG